VRLGEALRRARSDHALLVPYVLVDRRRTPRLRQIVEAVRAGGADALELGFPFSDPIADGPVLEAAAGRALAAGTTWADLLVSVRVAAPLLPTAVMTYANPVWRRGLSKTLDGLRRAGATGLIVPDLSLEESGDWRREARRHRLDLVLLAAPGAGVARVKEIARETRGFLYLVSRYGTTGTGRSQGTADLASLVEAARATDRTLPVLVGFGVRDPATARAARATGADGVVVGTALEERLARGDPLPRVTRWLRSLAGRPFERAS
jgi:tryptophan synthase alpha chain